MSVARIERLDGSPGERLGALVAESEASGLGLVRRLVEEWASGANRFDRPGEALFAAQSAGEVVGVCGLGVDPYAAGPGVGRVRHLYVLTAHRRFGVGERLVAAVVEHARGRFASLRLRTRNPEAAQLYERLGFRRVDAADHTHVMTLSPTPPEREVLANAYRAFNARDIEGALATLHPDVEWPNGMEGGHVQGHRGVRDYWTRQWAIIDPRVEPLRFDVDEAGRIVVDVRQTIRDLAGRVTKEQIVQHVYRMRDGRIVGMDIRAPRPRA